jgi:hypothetical protein
MGLKKAMQVVSRASPSQDRNSNLVPYATGHVPYCLGHFTCYILMTSATSQWTARNKDAPNKVHNAEFLVSRRFLCRLRYSPHFMKPEASLPCSLGPFLTQFSPANIITRFHYITEQDK